VNQVTAVLDSVFAGAPIKPSDAVAEVERILNGLMNDAAGTLEGLGVMASTEGALGVGRETVGVLTGGLRGGGVHLVGSGSNPAQSDDHKPCPVMD
jgi:hypothetical protein